MGRAAQRARRIANVFLLAARLSRLGPDLRARAAIFRTTVSLGARWILRRPVTRWRALRLRVGGEVRRVAVSDYGELMVIRDVLIDEEYALPQGADPEVILDVGANIGVSVLYFRASYPQARIVALEPDPESFAKLERNVGTDRRVQLVKAAAASRPGKVMLVRPPGFSIAATISLPGRPAASATAVRAVTLDDVCVKSGLEHVDVLKLDVEGAELDVLAGFSRLDEVGLVIGEAHPALIGDRMSELFARLGEFDVRVQSASPDSVSFTATARRLLPAANVFLPFVVAG